MGRILWPYMFATSQRHAVRVSHSSFQPSLSSVHLTT